MKHSANVMDLLDPPTHGFRRAKGHRLSGQALQKASMPVTLRCVGLCGIDESVDPRFVALLASRFPFAEWGVLFRPDKAGEPRYPRTEWLERLRAASAAATRKLRLAAHLCGERVNEVLRGDFAFVESLARDFGFGRVQINATMVNNVDTSDLGAKAVHVQALIQSHAELEFIIQKNRETEPLWKHLEQALDTQVTTNFSFLCDESCGRGTATEEWPEPHARIKTGYAGGIGPHNVSDVLRRVGKVTPAGTAVWIDMESRLRSSSDGDDIFDMRKAFAVLQQVEDDEATCLPA
mmetsp:Transcript_139971/g.390204  ORF Transcript_139971/g.390204 Transcript_139971/m.390204 type:complete len:293 (-) Transcript_139971:125-1003(-)